jgi:hypothetical protein
MTATELLPLKALARIVLSGGLEPAGGKYTHTETLPFVSERKVKDVTGVSLVVAASNAVPFVTVNTTGALVRATGELFVTFMVNGSGRNAL